MVCVGHCLDALGSQMCLWPLGVDLWWFITFLFFSSGSRRKQGSHKLAWILHRSAQFHGCCRYTFCSLTHGLKCKSSTKHTVTQQIHLSKNYQMSLPFQTPFQMLNLGGRGWRWGIRGKSGTWQNDFFQYVLNKISTPSNISEFNVIRGNVILNLAFVQLKLATVLNSYLEFTSGSTVLKVNTI